MLDMKINVKSAPEIAMNEVGYNAERSHHQNEKG
jgi:hypothetical protein